MHVCVSNTQLCPVAQPLFCAGDKACYSSSQYSCTAAGHLASLNGGAAPAPGAGAGAGAGAAGSSSSGGGAVPSMLNSTAPAGNATGAGISPGFAQALGSGSGSGSGSSTAESGGIMGGAMKPSPGQTSSSSLTS